MKFWIKWKYSTAAQIFETILSVCFFIPIFLLIFWMISVDLLVFAEIGMSILLTIGLLVGMLFLVWKHPSLRRTLAVFSLVVCLLFTWGYCYFRVQVIRDADAYLEGKGRFMDQARQVLPAKTEIPENVSLSYVYERDRVLESYVEVTLSCDAKNYADLVEKISSRYPVCVEDKTGTIDGSYFDCSGVEYYFADLSALLGEELRDYDYYYLAVGADAENCTVTLLFYNTVAILDPYDAAYYWLNGMRETEPAP